MKKTIALLLALVMAFALVACGGKQPSGEQPGGNTDPGTSAPADPGTPSKPAEPVKTDETLVVMLDAEPEKLYGDAGASGIIIIDAIAASLLEYDAETRGWTWGLAESYEKIDDTHYKFTLREGIQYADGTPVTAADAVYSLGYMNAQGTSDAQYFNMEEMEVIDDRTFVFALTQYIPGWEFFLAEHNGVVYSQAAVDAVGGEEAALRNIPVGCGKYQLKEWKSGEYILIERNENYYDKDYIGYYKYIKFMFVGDSASRLLAVKSGDAQVAYRISAAEYNSLKSDPAVTGLAYDAGVVYNVYFNNESGPCADVKVREALCYAIDGAAVNAVINMNAGTVAQGWLPASFPHYKDYGLIEYNPEKAKQMLADAGYPNGIDLYCCVIASHREMATVVQESMRQAGVNLTVEVLEQNVYLQKARGGEYDIQMGNNTVPSLTPNVFNQIDPGKVGKSVQSCRIKAPEVSDYIKMCNSSDEATSAEGWEKLTDYVFGNYCLKGLCDGDKYNAVAAGLTGLSYATRMSYIDVTNIRPQ